MTKILVTGGSGLVGKSLEFLVKDVGVDTLGLTFIFVNSKECDFRIEESVNALFEKHEIGNDDCVIHLASRVGGLYDNINHNYSMLIDNIKININVVEACRKFGVKRLINCLSTCVFGNDLTYPLTSANIHDTYPDISNEGYSFSKRILEISSRLLCNSSQQSSKSSNFSNFSNSSNSSNFSNFIEVVNLIPCNIYGLFDNYSVERGHIIPALIHKTFLAKTNNTDLCIRGYGTALRQFIYSGDFAKIIYNFVNIDLKEKYNTLIVGPPEHDEYPVKTVVDKIVNKMGFGGNIIYDSSFSNGQFKKTVNDSELLKYIPDFEFTALDDGLQYTIDYFTEQYYSGTLRLNYNNMV